MGADVPPVRAAAAADEPFLLLHSGALPDSKQTQTALTSGTTGALAMSEGLAVYIAVPLPPRSMRNDEGGPRSFNAGALGLLQNGGMAQIFLEGGDAMFDLETCQGVM